MFGLSDLKKTRVYQEAFLEGIQQGVQEGIQQGERREKLKMISHLLRLGLSLEQVAEAVDLSVEEVRQAVE